MPEPTINAVSGTQHEWQNKPLTGFESQAPWGTQNTPKIGADVVGVRSSAIPGEIDRNRDSTVDIGTPHETAE